MKMFFIVLGLTFFSFVSFSQVYVGGININDTDAMFCSFVDTHGKVRLDYGQEQSFMTNRFITNQAGNPMRFNSKVDVMNHLHKNGWDFLEIVSDSSFTTIYFMKRD